MFLCANMNSPDRRNMRLLCKALTNGVSPLGGTYMIRVDFSACFEWLNEDRQSHSLGLTPNFGLTCYKTHYLLYYGGGGKERERERPLEESRAVKERKLD